MYSIVDMIEADRPLLTHKTHKEINPLSKIEDFNISTQHQFSILLPCNMYIRRFVYRMMCFGGKL